MNDQICPHTNLIQITKIFRLRQITFLYQDILYYNLIDDFKVMDDKVLRYGQYMFTYHIICIAHTRNRQQTNTVLDSKGPQNRYILKKLDTSFLDFFNTS